MSLVDTIARTGRFGVFAGRVAVRVFTPPWELEAIATHLWTVSTRCMLPVLATTVPLGMVMALQGLVIFDLYGARIGDVVPARAIGSSLSPPGGPNRGSKIREVSALRDAGMFVVAADSKYRTSESFEMANVFALVDLDGTVRWVRERTGAASEFRKHAEIVEHENAYEVIIGCVDGVSTVSRTLHVSKNGEDSWEVDDREWR